jgi:Tfp pilus assembly protein PilF
MPRLAWIRAALLFASCGVLLGSSTFAMPADLANPIRRDLDTGHAQDALDKIDTALAQDPLDAQAFELRCRVMLQEQRWKAAAADCQRAVKLDPTNSDAHLWLGHAYGEEARGAPKLAAFALARKLRAEFEKAVQLDPANTQAYEALGSFYVQAPGLVGGGLDKAQDLEEKLATIDPAEAHELAAKIAENHKNYSLAEQEWKAAIQSSSYPAHAWMDLAAFYQRRGQLEEMSDAARTGAALDRSHGAALVNGALLLFKTGLDLPEAAQWLQEYLQSSAQAEEAPAFAVHTQLAQILDKLGQPAQAEQELAAARSLAPGYTPHS